MKTTLALALATLSALALAPVPSEGAPAKMTRDEILKLAAYSVG